MIARGRLLGLLGCAAAMACHPGGAIAGADCSLTVASAPELDAALKCADRGAQIHLQQVHYGTLTLRNPSTSGLTLRSADPARPARFAGMSLTGVNGMTLRDVEFRGPIRGQRYALFVLKSTDVTVQNVRFEGDPNQMGGQVVAAIMLRDSSGLLVAHSRFEQFWHGIAMLGVRNVKIAENRFANLRTDGVRGGGIDDLLIEKNLFSDFHPMAGDHPDGIQLWSTGQKKAGRDIVIRDNLVFRGRGAPTQGIFVRDTFNSLPFENVTVTGNLVAGGLLNGITVSGVTGGEIADNIVLPAPDKDSRMRLENARDVNLQNNRAGRFVVKGNALQRGNRVVSRVADPSDEIRQWGQLHGLHPLVQP